MKTRLVAALCAAILALSLLGCAGPRESYVKADRATYESLAPWVKQKADPANVEDAAKVGDLDAWELRIRAAEGEFNR